MTDDPAKCQHPGYSCSLAGVIHNPECPCLCGPCREQVKWSSLMKDAHEYQEISAQRKDDGILADAARIILFRTKDRDLARRVMELAKR